MTIRVALIIPTMDRGGAERQVCMLAAALPRERFDVHVVLLTREGPRIAELDQAGVPHTLVGKRGKADPTAYFRLRRLLRELRPDVVHTFLFAANSYGRAAAKSVGVPVIIGSERCVDPWKTWRHGVIDRRLAKISTAITTNSSGVRDFYAARGVPAELFRIIPNGIEPAPPSQTSRLEIARRLELDPQRHWIGAVGRLWPQKRYRDLIWATDMLNTLRPDDVSLVIVGDGPQRDELLRHRDAVSNVDRVRFVGPREDVAELLPHLDVFWLGSGYEGQSNALMEAMRAGRPCVATDIPGNRDLIEHDQHGLLVAVGDSPDFARQTQHLLEHPDDAARLGRAAAERIAREFSVSAMVDAHALLYESLTGLSGSENFSEKSVKA
ncbi:glycosyltransferase [Candidatus Laterigemmans baculatus]|uniref:glycosyltransferase n=1 Tax=Candidatus Laterigemmans baculatus TaxID=2770505 RepID=UPI001F3D1B23|nr:glycosyltransferase [Candidatus Laterigemmans baculatus]